MIGLIARPLQPVIVPANSSSASSQFPLANCLNNDYGRVVKSAGVIAANGYFYVTFDFGKPTIVDTGAVLWHNLELGDLIWYSGGATASDAYSDTIFTTGGVPAVTGITARDELALFKNLRTFTPMAYRYWCVKIRVGTAKQVQVSRIFLGRGAQFAVGPAKAVLGAKDLNASVQTEVGETRQQEDTGLIRPVISLSFNYAKQSEMEQVLGQYTLGLGTSKPMLICTDLASDYIQDNLAFGRPEKVLSIESDAYDIWSFEAVVTSLGV